MPTANGKITSKDVYEIVGEYRKEVNVCLTELRAQNTRQGEEIVRIDQRGKDFGRRLDVLDGEDGLVSTLDARIDDLRGTDRRWGALGALLGPILGAITGYFAGQR